MPDSRLYLLNDMDDPEAAEVLRACCGSMRWVQHMLARRPFDSRAGLTEASEEIWQKLSSDDWLEAFAAHPKIGETKRAAKANEASAAWSKEEQASTATASERLLASLAEGNRAYVDKFGFIFIICATGKSPKEMLEALRLRLRNTYEQELHNAAREQLAITQLRLDKWLRAGLNSERRDLPTGATMSISTHVLDTSKGRPAGGLEIILEKRGEDGSYNPIGRGVTNTDGRVPDLVETGQDLGAGTYRMFFDTQSYFESSKIEGFYPHVQIEFTIRRPEEHYHVPLLLSPFGYSTYRGS